MSSSPIDVEKPLIVVLGLGEMGLVHARNLSKDRRIRLGLACTRPAMLTSTSKQLHADATYSSYTSAIQDEQVCGIIIATSVETHAKLLHQSIINGKRYIFCEKPLGYNIASIASLKNDIATHGHPFIMVAFMRRWDPAYSQVFETSRQSSSMIPITLKCTTGDAEYPEKYRRDHTQQYPLLTDLAVHDIDLARWLLNSEVKQVFTIVSTRIYPDLKDCHDADTATVMLHMHNDATASFHLSRGLGYGYNVTSELVMDKTSFKIGALGGIDVQVCQNLQSKKGIDPDFRVRFQTAFEKEIFAFIDVVVGNVHNEEEEEEAKSGRNSKVAVGTTENPRYATFDDGYKATVVAEALVQSAKTGLPVNITYD